MSSRPVPEIALPDYLAEPQGEDEQPGVLELMDEAATKLGEQTRGLVQGKVYVAPFVGLTRYTFYLVVPAVNDYADPLFYVRTAERDKKYPVHVLESGAKAEEEEVCGDAAEFAERLNAIFRSGWAKSRVRQWVEMAAERRPTAVP